MTTTVSFDKNFSKQSHSFRESNSAIKYVEANVHNLYQFNLINLRVAIA